MKTYIKMCCFLAAVLIWTSSYAQRWKNDLGYSVHNYKHPNKSQAVKAQNQERLGEVKYLQAIVPVFTNYKAQNLVSSRKVELVQVWGEEKQKVKRNYKQQFAPIRRRK